MQVSLSMLVKKFSIPLLFTVAGVTMVVVGLKSGQDSVFMIAAIMMLAAALMSILYSTGKLTSKLLYMIGFGAGIAAMVTLFLSYKSVKDTSTYMHNYEMCKLQSIQNMQDIRFIQKAYADKNNKFLSSWDELVEYAKTGTVSQVIAKGNVPDTFITPAERDYLYGKNVPIDNKMTEVEAYRLSKWSAGPRYNRLFKDFTRDTVQVSLMESKFASKSYVRSRENAGLPPFSPDSLPFIPFTGAREKWIIETADSVQMGEAFVPALFVHGTLPFAKIQGSKNESISFGRLTSNDLSGSWEE